MSKESKELYEFGLFRLDVTEHFLARISGERVPLSEKVFETLCVLVRNGGHLLKKDELLNQIWADSFVEENNLDKCIFSIRRALGEKPGEQKFIETVRKHGYRFVAEVRRIEETGELGRRGNGGGEFDSISPNLRIASHKTDAVVALAGWRQETDKIQPEESNGQTAKIKLVPTISQIKRKPKYFTFILAGLICAFALGGIAYGLYRWSNKTSFIFRAGETSRLTSSGKVKTTAIAPDGSFIIYAKEDNAGHQSLWMEHIGSGSNVQIVPSSNIQYRTLNITPDGNSIYYLDGKQTVYQIAVLGGTVKKIAAGLLQDSGIGFSPNGKQFTFVRRFENDSSAIFIINADGTNEQKLVSIEQPLRLEVDPAWSPDGKIIACPILIDGLFQILTVQVADGNKLFILPKSKNVIRKLAWLPDSNSLIFIGTVKANFHQLFQISYPGGEAQQITSDLNNYDDFSLTHNGNLLAALKVEQAAHLWKTSDNDFSNSQQITTGFEKFDGIYSLDWLSESKILYSSSPSDEVSAWTIESNGDNPKQLLKNGHYPTISPDGRFIVYRERLGSEWGLLRKDLSDGSEKLLSKGTIHYPTFTPDGKWLIFTKYNDRVSLWRVPAEGGEATQILAENALCSAVSPDGKKIAFVLRKGGKSNRIALISFDGGDIIKTFDVVLETNPFSNNQNLQWAPDGQGIYFVALNNGVSNIWRQPIDGSSLVQVTAFETGHIFNFSYSPDGNQLALSRGSLNSDVVLINNLK